MDIQIINPITYPAWDELLISSSDYTFFHSSAWAKVLQETYHYTPRYFTVFENGRLQALIPVMEVKSFLTGKRGVSIPFTDYSDAIIHNGISFKNLFDQITQYGENYGWRSFELRGGQSLPLLSETSSTYSRHTLNLSENEDEIFSGFKASNKRNINRAIKKEVKVEFCCTLGSIQEFHRLNCMTRKRHGLPPQPFHFFEKVYEHIISQNLGLVVLASYKNNIIAGAVFFHFGENVFFKYGASDKNFHHLRPNNLIMWEAIKWFSKNGYKSICFGRTELENKGLRRFKSGWGAKERLEKYFKYDIKKNEFIKNSLEIKNIYHHVFRKMPLPLLNKVGSLFYRHVG